MSDRSPHRRWFGLLGLSVRLLYTDTRRGNRRLLPTLAVITLTIAFLVVVTGVGLGLSAGPTDQTDNADYWIVPESEGEVTTVVATGGPQLGGVHDKHEDLQARDEVSVSTPVLIEIIQVRGTDSEDTEYIIAVGIIPAGDGPSVAGVPTAALASGDPHYTDGTYQGEFTGDVVLSSAAAELLDVSESDQLVVGSSTTGAVEQAFSVTAVEDAEQPDSKHVPIAVVRLSELQQLTGAAEADQADQIMVQTTTQDAATQVALEQAYSDATVLSESERATDRFIDAELPLAMSLVALLVGFVITSLFITTAMSLETEANRDRLAAFAAVGIPPRERVVVIAGMTLTLAVLGGILGLGLGALGIALLNSVITSWLAVPPVATFDVYLAPYAIGVAFVAGLVAVAHPAMLALRTDPATELMR